MKRRPLAGRLFGSLLVGALAVSIAGCDLNDPDEVQNEANLAIVRAQFFASRESQTPVPGVRMVVEAPDDAERPYNGPDVVGISGEDGVAEVRVFPGLVNTTQGGGGGGTSGGGGGTGTATPQNPLELPPPLFFADVAVALIFQGRILSLISAGLTVGSGRTYDLGPVYLSDFGVTVN